MFRSNPVIAIVVIVAAVTLTAQRPEVQARVDALVAALSSGSPEQFEAMAREHYAPTLLASRTPEERGRVVGQIRSGLGSLQSDQVDAQPGHWEVVARGSLGGTVRIVVDLQQEA